MKKFYLLVFFLLICSNFFAFDKDSIVGSDTDAIVDSPFITEWDLSKTGSSVSSGTTSLTFGVAGAGAVNYTWRATDNSANGNGTIASGITMANISGLPANKTIELSIEPTNFRRININYGTDRQRLTDVKQWGTVAWSSMANAFYGCSNLNITATDIPNLNGVTDMSSIFTSCTTLNGPANINSWNVGNVTNMQSIFLSASSFNQNIGNWDVGNVTNMLQMFTYANSFNQNIGNWDVGTVTNMSYMFFSASAFNQNIGNWNVGNVTNMLQMLAIASSFNQNIGSWNVANVTNMQSMFQSASSFNQNIGNWTLNSGVNLGSVLSNSGLDCANYSATLMGWAANPATPSGRSLGATGRTYGTNATPARTTLTTATGSGGKGWTISGDIAGASACAPLVPTDYFITTWDLSKTGSSVSSGTTSLTFGVAVAGAVNYTWRTTDNSANGNGTIAFGSTTATITGLPANKTIELSIEPTNFRRIIINNGTDRQRPTDVKQWGTVAWSSMATAFRGCSNLNISATDVPNLNGVTDMSSMFRSCSTLNSPANINSWDTSNVTNMQTMFLSASVFNQPIGNWDVSKVTNMSEIFGSAISFNQNIGGWNVGNVTNMSSMFYQTTVFNQNIGSWDVSKVTNMFQMFAYANAFNQPIGNWDVSKVTDMASVFYFATTFNQNIGDWDVSKVTSTHQMFAYASSFNQDIGSWNVSNVSTMQSMFYGASAFYQNIGNWNVGNVTNMVQMFTLANSFNKNIGNWNVANVTNMQNMFSSASSFNQNLGNWTLNSGVNLVNMLNNSGLDCANYSATLMGWAANPATPSGRILGAFGRTYGTNAAAARNILVSNKGWTLTDDTAGVVACGTIPISADANNVLYVNTHVTGGNGSGNSWTNAIKELADALKWANTNKANFTTTPLQIWVAKGTYKPMYRPDTFAGPNFSDRNNSFLMVNNVKLYGGFAGTEATLAERNIGIIANATILSGDYNNNDVVTGTGATLAITGNGENAARVLMSTGAVGLAELNGFVVKGGYANGLSITVNGYSTGGIVGAGIYINTSNPTIQYCMFKENSTINAGGAMGLYTSSSKVINSLFINNLVTDSTYGGGAIITSGSTSQPVFINSTITGNRAANGGAMYNEASPRPKIYNTVIYGNSSGINSTTNNDIQNSLVQGINTTTNGNINGSTNPLFANASAGDFRLQSTSPVIDKGSNTLYNANGGNLTTDKDLAGNSRLNSKTIDMGAYEYTVVTVSAPTATMVQIYTGNGTIANLTATGDNLKWYATITNGPALASTTALTDNTRYYVSQTVNNVESTRTEVLAKRISDDAQVFCGTSTVSNLVATPFPSNTVNWYNVPNGGTALASTATLTTGDYYVEMQSIISKTLLKNGLQIPEGIASLPDGSIVFANFYGGTIQRMNADGSGLTTLVSNLSYPLGVNLQQDGKLLYTVVGSNLVRRMDADGSNMQLLSNSFNQPYRAIQQADGKILVADLNNRSIKKMNADGSNVTTFIGAGIISPYSVAEDSQGNIWVADIGNSTIKKYSSIGNLLNNNAVNNPTDLKVDTQGRIVFVQFNGELRRMNSDGSNLQTLATGFTDPYGLALEANGNILVADSYNNSIYRVIDASYITNRVKVHVTVNNFGTTAYVEKNVAGGNRDGSSWANAAPELADVMRCARMQYDANNTIFDATPLKVFVAKGLYKPLYNAADDQYKKDGGRNNAFVMVKNLQLYGGFDPANGIDDLTDTRIFGDSGSVLSGDYNDDDVVTGTGATLALSGNGENTGHVVISAGAVGVAELNGFVIKGGNANISNLTVNGESVGGIGGGGIFIKTSNPQIVACNIKENYTVNVGAGIAVVGIASPKIYNTIFQNNLSSGSGGAIFNENTGSNPFLINCTIFGNRGTTGGLYSNITSQPKIYNTIIYGNSSGINNTTGNDIQNSLIQGLSNTTNGNIDGSTNPLFVNPSSGDYRLQPTSPVIDKGSNVLYSASGSSLNTNKDFAGNNRLSECTIDMGANEYQNPDTYINWDGTSWSNTTGPTQSLGACINNNYNIANNFTSKNLKVLHGNLNIQPNSTVTVYGNITQSADDSIVLESDTNLIQTNDNATNDSKKITVKRDAHMRQLDYTYWGTPVSNQKLLNEVAINDGFSVGTPNNRIYRYNEPDDYFAATTDQYFVPGKGYAIRGKNTFDPNNLVAANFQFKGEINNGVYPATVQKSKNTIQNNIEYEHGYNLIGNPYPSNIDFDKFFHLNTNSNKIFGKVWFWTNVAPRLNQSGSGYSGNNYATLTLTGGTPPTTTQPNSGLTPTQFIKVGQGFIVQVRDATTLTSPKVTYTLDYNNSIRTSDSGVFYNAKTNTSEKDRFWIELVSPQDFTNTILVGYIPGASNAYEGDYDAEIIDEGDDAIYTKLSLNKLQIDGRTYPLSADDVVPLGIKTTQSGVYKIQLRNPEGVFSNNQSVFLKDKLLDKTFNLSENEYTYQAEAGREDGRFEIVYKPQTYLGTENTTANQLYVYKDDSDFVVKSNLMLKKVQLFDMSGRLIKEVLGNSKEMRVSHQTIINGAYVLKIYNGDNVVNKKVIK